MSPAAVTAEDLGALHEELARLGLRLDEELDGMDQRGLEVGRAVSEVLERLGRLELAAGASAYPTQ